MKQNRPPKNEKYAAKTLRSACPAWPPTARSQKCPFRVAKSRLMGKKEAKRKVAEELLRSLSFFNTGTVDCFICPTCLSHIPIQSQNEITEAHVLPKYAGGRLRTLLCRKCNSTFGSKQDKWLGDMLRIENSENGLFLTEAINEGYYVIDGLRVNGWWNFGKDNEIQFCYDVKKNSRSTVDLLHQKFQGNPERINISIPFPILRNKHLVDVGFLTAAYLFWFGLLGYSWALQSHLVEIRKQICNPEDNIFQPNYHFTIDVKFKQPWGGLIKLEENVVPAFGIGKHVVALPPRYMPAYYEGLKKIVGTIHNNDVRIFPIPRRPRYGPPLAILFEEKIIIFPEALEKGKAKGIEILFFTNDSLIPKSMHPATQDEFRALESNPNAKIFTTRLPKV